MGAPSRKQIDEAIAQGLARGDSEDAIVAEVGSLSRLSDDELAAMGIFPPPERQNARAQPIPRGRRKLSIVRAPHSWSARVSRCPKLMKLTTPRIHSFDGFFLRLGR